MASANLPPQNPAGASPPPGAALLTPLLLTPGLLIAEFWAWARGHTGRWSGRRGPDSLLTAPNLSTCLSRRPLTLTHPNSRSSPSSPARPALASSGPSGPGSTTSRHLQHANLCHLALSLSPDPTLFGLSSSPAGHPLIPRHPVLPPNQTCYSLAHLGHLTRPAEQLQPPNSSSALKPTPNATFSVMVSPNSHEKGGHSPAPPLGVPGTEQASAADPPRSQAAGLSSRPGFQLLEEGTLLLISVSPETSAASLPLRGWVRHEL